MEMYMYEKTLTNHVSNFFRGVVNFASPILPSPLLAQGPTPWREASDMFISDTFTAKNNGIPFRTP